MKKFLLPFVFLFPFLANAQISDDFTDGDLTNNPTWSGDIASFTIGTPATSGDGAINADAGNDAYVLSSNPDTDDAVITTPSNIAYGEWQFSVADGQNWSISSLNDYKIILISDDNTTANLIDGSSSLNFNGYFLRFDGGEDDQFILYKQTGSTSEILIDTDFPATTDGATALGRTIKVTRSETGDWAIFIDDGFDVNPTTQYGATVNDNTHTTSSYFGIATDIGSPSTERILHFDNLQITPLPTNDTDSQLSAGSNTEPATISSLSDTETEAVIALDFTFTDQASGDALPTIIDQLQITQGTENQITDWTNAIAGATLSGPDITGTMTGTINGTNIIFAADDFISVDDGTSETYQLKIWLKSDLSNINDNDKFDFELSDTNITTDNAGSTFAANTISSGAENIDISASKLIFSNLPTDFILNNSDFSTRVSAVDDNNNLDTDFTGNITLALKTGTGNLSATSGLSKAANNGTADWTDLQYDIEEKITISANGSTFSEIITSEIQVKDMAYFVNSDFETDETANWINTNDWIISSDSPITGTQSMKHNLSGVSGTSYIATEIIDLDLKSDTALWQFNVKYENTNPSGTNNFSIVLMSDKSDFINDDFSGYILGVNYANTTDSLALWKITQGNAELLLNTPYKWTGATLGIEIERTETGKWNLRYDADGDFDNLLDAGNVTDNEFTDARYCGAIFNYTTTWAGEFWFDDFTLLGKLGNNSDTQLTAGAFTEPASIASISDTETEAVTAFDFTFTDQASGDALPTIIDKLIITQGTNNNISDWTQALAGATLSGTDITTAISGTIYPDSIVFEDDNFISVADGTSETYKLNIWLQSDLSNINDNDSLDFRLSYSEIITDETGSGIRTGEISSGAEEIQITATELQFKNSPAFALINNDFNIDIYATDENQNTDNDFTGDITLSLENGTGTLSATSGLTKPATNGIASWDDLQYNEEADIKLSANASGLTPGISNTIPIKNIMYYIDSDFETDETDDWLNTQDWIISDIDPVSGLQSFKHNLSETSGISYFSRRINGLDITADTTLWQFNLKYENTNPSGSNCFGIVLMSDNPDLTSSEASAYVVGVNYSGSTDSLSLWKVTGGEKTLLIQSNYKWEGATMGIQVERSENGVWTLRYDDNGGFENLVDAGTATDASLTEAYYFGAIFNFTTSWAGKFWFDDALIYGAPDILPANLQSAEALSQNIVNLKFSEAVEQSSAENIANYSVDNGIGNPQTADYNNQAKDEVLLTFTGDFISGTENTLSVTNVADSHQNLIDNQIITFTYHRIAIDNISPVSFTELDILFNKEVDATTASVLTNYNVDGGIGNPNSATIDTENPALVHLTFTNSFVMAQTYTLTTQNVEDKYGNSIETTNLEFSYYVIQPFDVVINEIMCDITPPAVALPAYEYVEIYNNSDYPANLMGWTITIGTNSPVDFPATELPAHSYGIICSEEAQNDFSAFGITLPVLKESQLTSTGKQIIIADASGTIIENIEYDISWYNDDDKDGGGWSMERIDPTNFCGTVQNWAASSNPVGGTPGFLNSNYAVNPDTSAPELSELIYRSSKQITLVFSENLNPIEAENTANYTLNGSIIPVSATLNPTERNTVDLYFENNFTIGNNNLEIKNIEDNCGNIITTLSESFNYELLYPKEVEVVNDTQLRIHFSEKVDLASAQTISNYSVNNSIGNPFIATINNEDSSLVSLQFETAFTLGTFYTLSVSDIQDINANIMLPADLEFAYYIAAPFDIVFNEIMCDVSPAPAGLEAEKYLEIKNRTDYDINLNGWIFAAENQSEKEFPPVIIKNNSYLILCESDNEDYFKTFGTVAGIISSTDLSTTGKRIKLISPEGKIIDDVYYRNTWYDAEDGNDEGKSLERIDASNFCGGDDNWNASKDVRGGTPGEINSIDTTNLYTSTPELDSISIISSNLIQVYFTEDVSLETSENPSNYNIDNGIGNALTAVRDEENSQLVSLSFSNQFQDTESYNLTITDVSNDCGFVIEPTDENFTYKRIYPVRLYVINQHQLKLLFSENVDLTTGETNTNYTVDNSVGNPSEAVRDVSDNTIIYLDFDTDFPNGSNLTLSLANIQDVNGNALSPVDMTFSYYTPQANDLVINEVLYNTFTEGSDFVEIYNRSEYDIDLSKFSISTRDTSGIPEITAHLTADNTYIAPGEYMAFTEDRDGVMRFYLSKNELGIIEIEDMPTYSDTEGNVILLYNDTSVIDEFNYNKDMQFELLDDLNGVSLERVNYDAPTQDETNWHSASEFVGFATPAYKNSQYRDIADGGNAEIFLDPKVFSPNNDGIDDYLNIHYKFDDAEYVANIYIYDNFGRLIEQLGNNVLLSSEGTVQWDGIYETGEKARVGIYIIYFEAFDLNGNVKKFKESFTLAGKL